MAKEMMKILLIAVMENNSVERGQPIGRRRPAQQMKNQVTLPLAAAAMTNRMGWSKIDENKSDNLKLGVWNGKITEEKERNSMKGMCWTLAWTLSENWHALNSYFRFVFLFF